MVKLLSKFQFHKVQLKVGEIKFVLEGSQSFNSIRYN